jgi:hypothetical protein
MPFSIFASVFILIDRHVKQVVAAHFAAREQMPPWLPSDLGTPLTVPHWSQFTWLDPATRIRLVGAPDELTRCRDGRISILDYKTARWTNGADALLPLYHVQLNAYAAIAARLGLGTVAALWLIYCEPQAVDEGNPLALSRDDGFTMHFVAKIVPVRLQPEIIPPLLAQARRIADMPVPPAGRADCPDCRKLGVLLEMVDGQR